MGSYHMNKCFCKQIVLVSMVTYSVVMTLTFFVYVYMEETSLQSKFSHTHKNQVSRMNQLVDNLDANNNLRKRDVGVRDMDNVADIFKRLQVGQISPQEHRYILKKYLKNVIDSIAETYQSYEPFQQHFNTCAVVSGSGQLKGSLAGSQIDKAEGVIRMNDAPVLGYERDVGSKTSVRVIGFHALVSMNANQLDATEEAKTDMIIAWGALGPLDKYTRKYLTHIKDRYPHLHMYVFQNLVEKQFARVFQMESGISRATSTWISTGWLTLLLAIGLCDSIKVYGLIDKDYCKRNQDSTVPYHYYEEGKLSECEMYKWHEEHHTTGHPYIREEVIFRRFVSLFNITFQHPVWNKLNVNAVLDTPHIRHNPLKS